MTATPNGGENDSLKRVSFNLDSGSPVYADLTDEEIMLAHKTLGNPEAVLKVDFQGSRYLIPVRRVMMIKVLQSQNEVPPPPVAPDPDPGRDE